MQPREIFDLLGPNWAGKTTTIRLLTDQIDLNGERQGWQVAMWGFAFPISLSLLLMVIGNLVRV